MSRFHQQFWKSATFMRASVVPTSVSPKETFSPHARHRSLTEAARVLLKARALV